MAKKLRITGVVLVVLGLIAMASSAYAYMRVQDGADALQGFSDAQNVTLSYDADGQLIDRGTTEGADAILALLSEEWMWPVNDGELDPNDPVVDTGTEYMYQMATIAFHTLNGTQTVTLDATVEYDANGDGEITQDEVFAAGTYEVPVEGKYWSDFDRQHPLEGPARAGAWTGTVHGLFAELGVGATTASSLQLGLGIAAVTLLMGVGFLATGGGLIWAGMGKKEEAAAE
jgi:YD repeat-containing protein